MQKVQFQSRGVRERTAEVHRVVVALPFVNPVQRLQQHVVRGPNSRKLAPVDGVDDEFRPLVASVGTRVFVVDENVRIECCDCHSDVLDERRVVFVAGDIVRFEVVTVQGSFQVVVGERALALSNAFDGEISILVGVPPEFVARFDVQEAA